MKTEQTKDTTYNGWTNYETWIVNMWMDDSRESQDDWLDIARQSILIPQPSEVWTKEEAELYTLEDRLKELHQDKVPDGEGSFRNDLFLSALSNVNWREIAAHWLAKAKELEAA